MRRIYLRDLQRVMYCHKGTRQFFDRYDLDWNDFRKNGIDADTIRATGDAMALRLLEMIENE